jgi:hypothetical protein
MNNSTSNFEILREGLHLTKELSDVTPLIAGPTAICHRLQQSSQLIAYLIAQRQPETSATEQAPVQLIDQITEHRSGTDLTNNYCNLNKETPAFTRHGRNAL